MVSAAAPEATLFSVMTGKKEVGPDGKRGAGDPDGRGSFTAQWEGNTLCWGLTVKRIGDPVAAHIHPGTPGQNGPPLVTLTPPADGSPGTSSDCTEVPAADARSIRRHPRRFYVNVHTADFQGGAVRGQLFARRR